ncbi:MAG: hypothetical protein QOD31_3340, partial [Pseudonocardiales bacterium]|nr:hypothetical protein [Pseudonocardiales bacterium]
AKPRINDHVTCHVIDPATPSACTNACHMLRHRFLPRRTGHRTGMAVRGGLRLSIHLYNHEDDIERRTTVLGALSR